VSSRLRVLILGSTGSIGTQALEVIAANPDRFEVVGLAAGGGNPGLLARQRAETGVSRIAVADPAAADRVGDVTYAGPDAATRLVFDVAEKGGVDVVLNALVGALGLEPTLAALATGARLALANKESLVAGGPLVVKAARPGQIVPVDSEHSALAQCLRAGDANEVARLVLTASGGPFRGWSAEQLESVTPQQAGAHPTWNMGPMNTLNSASLVNKGLELIETHLLFGIPYDRIDVVVHPQSIVHSMVTFVDGSTIAQASPPDMKLPISLALGWPQRVSGAAPACDFSTASTWEFEPVDAAAFPAVSLARQAGEGGGCLTAVYNAANEEAAEAFLGGRIRFPAIVRTIADVLGAADQWAAQPATVEDVLDAQQWARQRARDAIDVAARVRPHVGGPGHRDEGAPLLRRFRPDAVVHPTAQQTGLHRIRHQGRATGRVLRYRRNDRHRRPARRRPAVRDVQAEDLEASGRAVRRPSDELHHRPGVDLLHRRGVGPAQPASTDHRGGR
jgi:1-deoxy-D-xylulose-5-phosphate reductoisomerase